MRNSIAALLILSLMGCNTDTNTYTLSGKAAGMEDGSNVIIYTLQNNRAKVIDTLTINGGTFSGTFPKITEPALYYMVVNNSSILYFPESEDLKATIYKDSIQASYVSGNAQNDSYKEFNIKTRKIAALRNIISDGYRNAKKNNDDVRVFELQKENVLVTKEEINYKKEFAKENPNSMFALLLVSEMLNQKQLNAREASDLVANFSPKIANTSISKDITATAENLKKSDVGGKAPMFSAKTPEGKDLSLQDAMGKYTIIDFWASWCGPCRKENPNVVQVYEKYHAKGLNIISVSLDKAGQENRWEKAIKKDNMNWFHVSNLMFWKDPIAQQYGVRSIPATFLLDENGIIIAKDLRGKALGLKVASLLD
jgi:thiol-disulfide isomerase/thioredoxin